MREKEVRLRMTKKMNAARMHGFTLVELLVVIGILAILTAVVLVAVNPGRQLAQARNTERRAEVNTILAAVTAYLADPDATGSMPSINDCATGPDMNISDLGGANDVDLSFLTPLYVAELPEDPQLGDGVAGGDTGYDICAADVTNQRYTVKAPGAELSATIEVTR